MKNVPSIIDGIEFQVNGQVKVTSLYVAEKFEKEHKVVMRSIVRLINSGKISRDIFIPRDYEVRGRKYSCYDITKDGFALLAMGFTGDNALDWKVKFLAAFNKMAEFVKAELGRQEDRAKSAMLAPEMTDALKERREDLNKTTSPFHYSNEFNMINKIVLGATKKQWCEALGISKKDDFRENLLPVQIEAVQNLQTANTVLIETGMDYKERKKKLENIYKKKFAERCLDEVVRFNA